MSDDDTPAAGPAGHSAPGASRRTALRLGAAGVLATVTVRPAFAQAAVSVMNCEIPVPDPARAGQHIAADGSVVRAGTPGAVPGAATPLKGEDVRRVMRQGGTLPGTSYQQSDAYIRYVRRLRTGNSGFTCFASIQMPR